ncbi:hypothetical protein M231_03281 [Tremella mesenterica]|uniref:Uncharacterized protein n=1 Tax=Tremella mesenterica TaxID=5217 RepID=A0A4Q1BNK6_TREME|nr:hypothetical protein M231_03281 [Tremella mesenterica]
MSYPNQSYAPYSDPQPDSNFEGNSRPFDPDADAAVLNPSLPTLAALISQRIRGNPGSSQTQLTPAGINLPSGHTACDDPRQVQVSNSQAQDYLGYYTHQTSFQGSYPLFQEDDREREETYNGYPTSTTFRDRQDRRVAPTRQYTGGQYHRGHGTTQNVSLPVLFPSTETNSRSDTDRSLLQMLGRQNRPSGSSSLPGPEMGENAMFRPLNMGGYGTTSGSSAQITYQAPPSQQGFIPPDEKEQYAFADRTMEEDWNDEDREEVFGQGLSNGHTDPHGWSRGDHWDFD